MIQYKVVKRRKVGSNDSTYHAAIVSPAAVNSPKIIERIEKKCTLASSDIKAVLDALEVELIDALRDGNAVRFGDLGSFRPTIHSTGAATPEGVNAGNIKKVHVVFVPTLRVKQALDVKSGAVKFAKAEVVPVAKKKKAAQPGVTGAQPGVSGEPAAPGASAVSAQPAAGDTHSEG